MMRVAMRIAVPAGMAMVGLALFVGSPAMAQTAAPLAGGDGPVEVEATYSLEWHQDRRAYVARGDAVIRQGEASLSGDVITAYYRDIGDGETEIFQVTAEGNVVVEDPTSRATGDQAVYDADRGVYVLTGEDLRYESGTDVVTARDSLEYWAADDLAVARGDAVAQGDGQRVEADVLTANFAEGADGAREISVVSAMGNVLITDGPNVASGDEGVYDLRTSVATLDGNVYLSDGENTIRGAYAEMNLDTGMRRVLAGDDGRVQGLLIPGQAPVTPQTLAPQPAPQPSAPEPAAAP